MKRLIHEAYAALAGRKVKPFVYLALKMRSCDVDPNVHPTKQQVGFLNQNEVLATVENAIRKALSVSANSFWVFFPGLILLF